MDALRNFFLAAWRRNVWTSLRTHLHREHGPSWQETAEVQEELRTARSCLRHATGASWWE
jgi:hypothetical protein